MLSDQALKLPARRMLRIKCTLVIAAFTLCSVPLALAGGSADPTGYWVTVDDDGKTKKSIVQISRHKGTLYGKVVKILNPKKKNARCTECSGKRKDKPVLGMVIMWGLKKDDAATWDDGTVLDPNNGKEYSCKLELSPNGKSLEVRGYLGISLFGRTQRWLRSGPP